MKRLFVLLLLFALPAGAAEEKWWESYNRGVKAVNAKSYDVAAAALQKAIAQMPNESTAARAGRNDIITYVPHFWLGIARFNLGDVDGALAEWKTSEDQGAIARTDYYPKLRDWVARAQTEKERSARSAAGESKKAADAALSRALNAQVEALTAGGDRTDTYRTANRKLQEALGVFNSAGSKISAYERAEATAVEARDLFARSADEARRLKTARAATPPRVSPPPAAQQQVTPQQPAQQPAPQVVISKPAPVETPPVSAPQQPPVTASAASEGKRQTAQQTAAVSPSPAVAAPSVKSSAAQPQPVAAAIVSPSPKGDAPLTRAAARAQLESAYRAFATGNLDTSEQVLTSLLGASPSGEAFLLRGCARYTRAMLSRKPDPLLDSAKQDFREALKMKRSLRLDSRLFSPKLVAFFDEVRKGS